MFNLSRKIQKPYDTRMEFANALHEYLQNRACFALCKTLLGEPDNVALSGFWEQVTLREQQKEVQDLLGKCIMNLQTRYEKLQQQMLLTREDQDN